MQIFGFVKNVLFIGLTILSNFTNASSLSSISMNNEACKARPEIVNVNSNNPILYPRSIKISKCGNCNNINDPYSNICATACNNKQLWNEDKCRCECKVLIDKGVCDEGCIWNSSNCECEYDKSCDVGEYLDYKNCTCRKGLIVS